jgi:renalase
MSPARIAIIGAGVAGLACARVLSDAGHHVRAFDKGRGPGGRLSTRRTQTDVATLHFDHGAQYFTARDPAFRSQIDAFIHQGSVAEWHGSLVRLARDGTNRPLSQEPLYVGTPGMNSMVRAMAAGLDVAWAVRVGAITRQDDAWHLADEAGAALGAFDQIVCAVPAEQVAPLLEAHASDLASHAKAITSLPCWAGMFAFDAPLASPFDAIRLDDHPVIDFIAANHSKPGRADMPPAPTTYVVHARADWSIAHLEDTADNVADALAEGLVSFADNRPNRVFSAAHRWRYAKVEVQHGPQFGYDAAIGIGACGDWLSGPRVESAWCSGHALGQAMVAHLNPA